MSKILETVGNFISSFFQYGENYFFAIICFALIVKLIFLFSSFKYFKSIKISDALRPEVAKINRKHKNNSNKATQEVTQLLMKSGYSVFGGIGLFVLHAIIGALVAFTFKYADIYLKYAEKNALSFFGLDLTLSPVQLFLSADVQYSGLICLVLFIFAMGLQIYVDILMEKKLVTDQASADKIIWAITGLGLLFAPSALSVCWLIFKLFDLGTYVYVVKFYKATFVPAVENDAGKKGSSKNK